MSASEDILKLEKCVKHTYPNYKCERSLKDNVYCLQVVAFKGLYEIEESVYAIGNELFLLGFPNGDETFTLKKIVSHLENLAKWKNYY